MSTVLIRRREQSMRVAPVRELFEHLAEAQDFYASLVASGKVHDVFELGQGIFARGIQQRMMEVQEDSTSLTSRLLRLRTRARFCAAGRGGSTME